MTTASFRVRPASEDDDGAIREISAAYGNLQAWPSRPDFLDHEAATGRMYVAEGDEGVLAFGGSFDRGDVVYLADLFVHPDAVERGMGSALLERIFDRGSVRMTSASSDPRALPLYARFGMIPQTPALYLRGTCAMATAAASAMGADGGSAVRLGSVQEIAALDAEASGRSRPQEFEFLASCPGAEGLVLVEGGAVAAYGWTRVVTLQTGEGAETHGYIEMAGARSPEAMGRLTGELLLRASAAAEAEAAAGAKAAGGTGTADVALLVLGPHPALRELLTAGLRVFDRDTFMCSRLDLIDGRRYAHSPELG